jgi:hypothetical protein
VCGPISSTESAAVPSSTLTSTIEVLKKFSQCGGISWGGSGSCEVGTTCKEWNPYYHQCV